MPRPHRSRLVTALVVVLTSVLAPLLALAPAGSAAASPAGAPEACAPANLSASLSAADAVFTGVVTDVTRSGTAKRRTYDQEVTADRIYQGTLDQPAVQVRTTTGKPCALGKLTVDERYVFVVQDDGGYFLAAPRGGTGEATDALVGRVSRLLGPGESATSATGPVEVDYTQVAADQPTPFLRVAAPGMALFIVGVLGLILVRTLRRRTA